MVIDNVVLEKAISFNIAYLHYLKHDAFSCLQLDLFKNKFKACGLDNKSLKVV